MYYRGAKAAILVFDLTNEETFHRVITWLRDLKAHADPNVVVCLAGNKCDMTPTFDSSICESYAASFGAKFIKTSALTGHNVDSIFLELSQSVLEVHKSKMNKAAAKTQDSLKLIAEVNEKSTSSCC